MSELKVNKISPRSGTDVTLGDSGDTFTIPAGASMVNNGTATGFGLTWQSVQTTGFTAVKGNAYPCDTTSAGFTVTLPATPSAGDQVQLVDYAGTFDTNKLIIDGNGEDIEGLAEDFQLTGEREGVILTYIDSTQGWIATSGINEGTDALEPNTFLVDFLVIAGGGGGGGGQSGSHTGAGGGAGGYRTSVGTSGGGASAETALTIFPSTNYTVTVGSGGSGGAAPDRGSNGNNSVFYTITSTAGGGGGSDTGVENGNSGGSGGGGGGVTGGTGGAGTANQGFAGGAGHSGLSSPYRAGGGGGAGQAGATGTASGNGGNGVASSITGTSITRGGGGGGTGSPNGSGGTGGGGNGGALGTGGSVNTGGGGGGGATTGYSGGSGIVIVKYPDTLTITNPGGGLTSSTVTAGGFSVTSFTAGTGTIQFN
jgi:hypothetical protein